MANAVTFNISEPRVAYIINCRPKNMIELERERVRKYLYCKVFQLNKIC